MDIFSLICSVVAILLALTLIVLRFVDQKLFIAKKLDNTGAQDHNKEGNQVMPNASKDFFLATLVKMGCSYEFFEDDKVAFTWQGGCFFAIVGDDSPYVVVWLPAWCEYELYDIDAFSRLRKVINNANYHHEASVVYTIDNDAGLFKLHTKKHFLFVPSIDSADDYLQSILGEFFVICRFVETEFEKLKNEEDVKAK